MQYSTNYNLNLVEGTDIVNPLVIDKPNYQTIDTAMKANKDAAVNSASHTKAGTVHAIVRSNTDANTFRFVASAPFTTGDTFTVDGAPVTGINTAGEGLETNDFVIGASVLCVLNAGTLTLNVNKKPVYPSTYDASDIVFDNTGTGMSAINAQDAIEELNTNINGKIHYDHIIVTTGGFGEFYLCSESVADAVLAAWTDYDNNLTVMLYNQSGAWYGKVTSITTFTNLANTANVTIYYCYNKM